VKKKHTVVNFYQQAKEDFLVDYEHTNPITRDMALMHPVH
jgi:hypothetical protein